MTGLDARASRRRSVLGAFGADGHPEDRFWARPSDLAGVGFLRDARVDGDRLRVEVWVHNLLFYLDSTILASFGDLANIRDIPFGARVAFSGNVRAITDEGVRLGRLNMHPCGVPIERAVLTPTRDESNRTILFGEVAIPDPDPGQPSFLVVIGGKGVHLATEED